ncbi:MAG: Nramp family divalent metal transporter [Flavobacteriaceae bacterium]|nr:Nramp family divalent metal transporter [Flavobacteriaceae bacterium]
MKKFFSNIGPGTLVAAAFIGPGTVTVCTLAGVQHGFTLLWAMLLSIVATLILQEMAARLGLVTGKGLAETVKNEIRSPLGKGFAIVLILSAILIGNAAYEAGNISGGALGLETLIPNAKVTFSNITLNTLSIAIGLIAFVLLYIGNYKVLERSLVFLVVLMSLSFLITALLTQPNLIEVLAGIFVPKVPEEGWLTVIALVGTTVVPYNLFLHASLVREKWKDVNDLPKARKDARISIILGGLVSMAIIICGAAISSEGINNASDLAQGLEPLFGSFSKYFLSIGLFAAGITSAITAPLAAAYVVRGCFGWDASLKSIKFRAVWIFVLLLGVVFSSIGISPIEIIKFAQVANGLLLPIIAAFLLWVVNRSSLLGRYKNSLFQNGLGWLILLTALLLGARSLFKVFNIAL